MQTADRKPLMVLYVPGLDRRRIDAQHTPFIHNLLTRHGEVTLRTLPTTELLPTMITGVLPHQHRLWAVSLKPDRRERSPLDILPDLLTTTLQCARHVVDVSYDLPAIPYWRRRQFVLHRLKYTRRVAGGRQVLHDIGGYPTLFSLVAGSRYHFAKTFREAEKLLATLPTDGPLEFFEHYAFDLYSHWNLDRLDDVLVKAALVDEHARRLHERCAERGARFALLVDHGQEPVRRQVNLIAAMQSSGVPRDEFVYFVEVATARLWFFTERARREVLDVLRATAGMQVLHRTEMHEHGVCFEDDAFGEYYAVADPATTFFPHDFYQPLANLYMSLRLPGQGVRRGNPIHRGYHGHLPTHPAERGYLTIADDALAPVQREGSLLDIAPTVLNLLGVTQPHHMTGCPLFAAYPPPAAARP